jgi:hypothetical protein
VTRKKGSGTMTATKITSPISKMNYPTTHVSGLVVLIMSDDETACADLLAAWRDEWLNKYLDDLPLQSLTAYQPIVYDWLIWLFNQHMKVSTPALREVNVVEQLAKAKRRLQDASIYQSNGRDIEIVNALQEIATDQAYIAAISTHLDGP